MNRAHYEKLVKDGDIRFDNKQLQIVEAFDRLNQQLLKGQKGPFWKRFFAKPLEKRGLYIYGHVGRGKTMLMDLFFSSLPLKRKRRAHFNDFMIDIHQHIKAHRTLLNQGKTKQKDPIVAVAETLAYETELLCFDEFSVTDIADAMILGRLFTVLFQKGIVLVATSNVVPDQLYSNGLNRGLFLPFIDVLKKHTTVINLDADVDYRLEKKGNIPIYISPLGEKTTALMDSLWAELCRGKCETKRSLIIAGRPLFIARSVGDQVRFSYQELCAAPLSTQDYLALSKEFETFMLDDIPIFTDSRRNEAKRFILLIDTLYDRHKRLILSAAAPINDLYQGRQKNTERFEFERTQSRLFEMQSADYLKKFSPLGAQVVYSSLVFT